MTTKLVLKVCSMTALVLLVFVALGPATWQPRSGLGWEIDRRLFRFHIDVLPRLAPAVPGRGSPHGRGDGAGELAISSTGSLVLFCGGLVQRSRGAGRGSAC
jgi:hypothetical protein